MAQLAGAYDRWWQSVLPDFVNENKDGPAENPFKLAHRRQIERQPLEAYAPAQTTSPVAGGPAAPAVSAKQRPSVLVILSDDQRADTIHALGNQQINTPGLDALVAQGTVFNRAYCMGSTQGAVCILSRAMLLTGRSLFRVNEQLSGCDTWPEAFARSGYRTFITGKWHSVQQSLTRCFSSGTHVFLGGMHDQWSVPVVNFSAHGSLQPVAADDRHSCQLFGDAAGVPPPAKNEGQSLLPVLRGECPVIRENLLLAYRNSQRAWVGPEWKLIEYPTANKTQLFNVARDPDEIVNVADQPNEAGRVNRLKAERALQQQQAGDPLQVDRRRATGIGKP